VVVERPAALTRGQGTIPPDGAVSVVTTGAGGHGPPSERDPALVRRDVEDGLVTREVAQEVHGAG
jgi:N-methylhydantoinase B